ncbi:aspartate aminotransferase family protein [Aureimonas populi]|uniref:Aspartate aminotransferase family protein n=1 Tax=Aureimonas populi TaxID=1701758 RepID=A0ABW5CM76_9HYPH|nr:aminotransferase class III-fold pyridoxal phosphate-dependent enzyme [Aureimonas populi]
MSQPAAPLPSDPAEAMLARRRALLGGSYRLFYERPVHLVRGEGVWLFDAEGRRYLDAYNNVPAVGHSHPRVNAAVTAQMGLLNTHTRYLHEAILSYSERLLATFPEEIAQVMYTCTGSEAVDLALRIARHHTQGAGVVVTANAYHGTTAATVEISPSLGPAVPLGRCVRTVEVPGEGPRMGRVLAENVAAAFADLARHGIRPAAFVADGIFSTDGVRAEPAGFLQPVLEAVHAAGALYVADEVQPGFGRTGGAFWGFQRHSIVPDMAVMGKPMGNGLPIAALALRPEVGERFGREVRYFNTFGANHVSLAAAGAVLDVIEAEGLQANAARVGTQLLEGLKGLAGEFDRVGEARGAGLFLALDLRDGETGAPDAALATRVVNSLRERGVLIGASGPAGNVLKIRPPLPFASAHADLFLAKLREVLAGTA